MRIITPKLLIPALAVFMWSCGSDDNVPDGKVISPNFVQVYMIPDRIELYALDSPHERYISVAFSGTKYNNRQASMMVEFDKLAQKYNDLSYNEKLFPNTNLALGTDYSSVRITCDKPFDEGHPAGKSLGDVVWLCANSYKMFIESGYDTSYKFPDYVDDHWFFDRKTGLYPVFKVLDEVMVEDLTLIEPSPVLYFSETPEAPGDYLFTIEILSDEAPKLSGKVTVAFK